MSKSTFIGTKLEADDFRNFGIRAAERGRSKSALMRELALEFLSAHSPANGPRKTAPRRKTKGDLAA